MLIGVPKEIKDHEFRVGLTPSSVREITHHGHAVLMQTGAGHEIGLDDHHYQAAGARIAAAAEEIYAEAQLIVKVKEPQAHECRMLRADQVIFTYLHLAPDPEQTRLLVESGCVAIAYETVTDARGRLPLLAPMSEVAGRMSIQAGAHFLERTQGGRGVLLGGVPGVPPGHVVILGGGVVGSNAARMALGLGARVTILDKSMARLAELDNLFCGRVVTLPATMDAIEQQVLEADLVIGAVLVPGAGAPRLITRQMVADMRRGAVIVDVAIDQGGCTETGHPTTHSHPTFVVDEVVHYCVANMPGGVARTSTFALNNATLPFVLTLAAKGYRRAMLEDPHLRAGLNVYRGHVTYPAVAQDLGYTHLPAERALAA
ncbi:MAG: alanine dehydrogenase [Alphaproteobacteria bacterium]|nr:alanine dehydrogenase [Alphaproteobacteria bacterium]